MEQAAERRLIRQAQSGSRDAADALLTQHTRAMWRIVCHTRSRSEMKEDLYQWACLFFLQSIQRYNLRDKRRVRLSTWTYGYVQMRVRAAAWRHGLVHLPPNATKTDPQATDRVMKHICFGIHEDTACLAHDGDAALLDDREEHLLLHEMIQRLPQKLREVIEWRLAGRTLSDVGMILGLTKERIRQIEEEAIVLLRFKLHCVCAGRH